MKSLVHVAAVITGAIAISGALDPSARAQNAALYSITRSVPLGAPDRWDYVAFDPASHRVYVSHGDRLTVVDGRDGTIVGQVQGFPGGTHGIAIVAGAHRGYTDDGRAGEAGAFDLQTLAVQPHIKAGADADGLIFDAISGHVFVIDGDTGTLTVIDPVSNRNLATIAIGGKLEFGVAGGDGKLYVNGEERQQVVRIDSRTNQVDARWPIPECSRPHGMALDAVTHRLFVSCVNSALMVLNIDTGAVVVQLPIGRGTDAAAFDPKRKLVFSANGQDGTLSIIQEQDAQTFISLGELATAPGARTMSIDPDSGRLYLVAAEFEPAAAGEQRRRAVLAGSVKLLFLDPRR